MLSKQQRLTAFFMVAIFQLEFVPKADLYKTANYLRTLGFSATVLDESKNIITIEEESYNKALEKLSPIVPTLPDIFRFSSKNGEVDSVIYETQRTDKFIQDAELTDSLKVFSGEATEARVTVVLREDSVIKYTNVVRKIENMGYKVTFADGYRDAGWMSFPAIDIEIANNIAEFRDAILKLTEIPEVNRFLYNRGKNPHTHEYTVSFEEGTDFETQISKLLANGIEVYKIDKLLNKLFIHFPSEEAQNQIKLKHVRDFEGLVAIKNLHENQHQFSKPEYAQNVQKVWLDVPVEMLKGQWNNSQFAQALTGLARDEVKRLQEKGMIILHYGLYAETGEVLLPEVVFTYRDADSPKAEEILKTYKDQRSDVMVQAGESTEVKKKPARRIFPRAPVSMVVATNMCAQLF